MLKSSIGTKYRFWVGAAVNGERAMSHEYEHVEFVGSDQVKVLSPHGLEKLVLRSRIAQERFFKRNF